VRTTGSTAGTKPDPITGGVVMILAFKNALGIALLSAVVGASMSAPSLAQSTGADTTHARAKSPGRLLGVYDETSGDPVAGADVVDVLTGDHTQTSATGTVSLWFVRAKGSMVRVRKVGYQPWQGAVDPADTTPITVVLKHAVAELPTVVSTAKSDISKDAGVRAGFEHRCEATNVSCVREDVIASHPSETLGDLILKTSGILAVRGVLTMHSLLGGYCTPNYFVDGHEWNVTAMGGPPIDQPGAPPGGPPVMSPRSPSPPFSASNVEKVEVYPSDAARPLRFAGNSSCGTIAIWTK
jgi:hypothetical protein